MIEIHTQPHMTADSSRSLYESIYGDEGIQQLPSFYAWLMKLIAPAPNKRMLDVACGMGDLAGLAAQKGVTAFGVDISETAVRLGRAAGKASFAVSDGERIPFASAAFDIVTSIGSLEHYVNPLAGAIEMCRVLSMSGRCIILLPNTYSILHNIWTVKNTGRTAQDNQPIQRYASRLEWQDLLEQAGFQVIHTVKYEREFPRNAKDALWYLRHPKDLVRLALTPLIPLNWASCFVFVCQKKRSS